MNHNRLQARVHRSVIGGYPELEFFGYGRPQACYHVVGRHQTFDHSSAVAPELSRVLIIARTTETP